MAIKDIASPGSFFKGAEYYDHAALLIEVKKFEADRPSNFGPKDTVIADVHAFATAEDVDAGEATILRDTIIQSSSIVRDLKDLVGDATIVQIREIFFKRAGKHGPALANTVSAGIKRKIAEYAEAYEAQLQAEMDDAPDFED